MLQILRPPTDELSALLFLQAAATALRESADQAEIKVADERRQKKEMETDEQIPSGSRQPFADTTSGRIMQMSPSSLSTQKSATTGSMITNNDVICSDRATTPEGNENGQQEQRKRRGSILRRPSGILSQNNNGESRSESPSKAKKRVRFDVPDNAPERETSPSVFRLNDAVSAAKRRRTSLIGICFPSNGDALIGGIGINYANGAALSQPVA